MTNKTEKQLDIFCEQLAAILVEQVLADGKEDDENQGQVSHPLKTLAKRQIDVEHHEAS